jgi:general stress protein 26
MLKRIKRLWQLSKRDNKLVDKLTLNEIVSIPLEGDGKAQFIGEGTREEFEEQEKKDKGLFNLFKVK